MSARELIYVIQTLKQDGEHYGARRTIHENYEWLEGFWRHKYNKSANPIDDFVKDKGKFYWGLEEIRDLAKAFASIECVGSNKEFDYTQTTEVARATMYLRYSCNLFSDEPPNCSLIKCRKHKTVKGLCLKGNANLWKKDFDVIFAFKALLYIVRQVRNNLFHGHKLTIEPIQLERDKILVHLSAQVTEILLNRLIDSGD